MASVMPSAGTFDSVDGTLARGAWQPVLFAERPSRLELMKLHAEWELTPLTIRIHRNHSFEHVASATCSWFAWWGRDAQFVYSDYDDSLSFSFPEEEQASIELVWLDAKRYEGRFTTEAFASWIHDRCVALRLRTSAPIIVAIIGTSDETSAILAQCTRSVPGLRMAHLSQLAEMLGARFFDERASKFSGTRLSDAACLLIARELSCRWVPALLMPRIKAVVLDLDNTLHEGVLGEDGHAVRLTPGHHALQQSLVRFREGGVFLGLSSRNDDADVRRLFDDRPDFPLQWSHFSATAVSWGSKADGIRTMARHLRIGVNAILFVDDNPGELASVTSELPGISVAHAMPDAAATQRMLDYYPGLWAWETTVTDVLRASDLAASIERAQLVQGRDPLAYLRSLQVRLLVETNPWRQLARLHELSNKTNQFNLALQRMSEPDLAAALDAPDHGVALVSLNDRLSDSGPIALIMARREGNSLVVIELAISCRALGRCLEDVMIAAAIRAIRSELPTSRVEFLHRTGPRNTPAREWLARLTGQVLRPEGRVSAPVGFLLASPPDFSVHFQVMHHEPRHG
ncbi:MAG: subfamily HAD-superfamily phosphatase [Gemmatimonadetes bacterium]|nr:subfamily HAD-superfamily phosphatase [Gemmatimonadota bacterium]